MAQTEVQVTAGSNRTIQEFQRLIEQRIQWMHETKRDAVAAIALTMLRSVRAATKVANPSRIEQLEITTTPLVPSFSQEGGVRRPCLRNNGGVKYSLGSNERLIFDVVNPKGMQVFKYKETRKEKERVYYIVAPSLDAAQNIMKTRIAKRIHAWGGLARKALSVLMHKACTVNDTDQTNQKIAELSDKVTNHQESGNGQNYSLTISDLLDYATLAIEGGGGTVDMALQKAANKAASVINQRCGNGKIFNFEKLETPFPEVSKHKR